MSLDRALDGVPFAINKFRCLEAARMLSAYEAKDEEFPWSTETQNAQLIFKILFISICHQMNWDVLQDALARWMLPSPDKRLDEFSETSPSQIRLLLEHYPKQERVRASERARKFRQTANDLKSLVSDDGQLRQLAAKPRLEGPGGFYEIVGQLEAYQGDPIEKKIRVLAHDLYREKIMEFSDPQALKPAVEYHLIRLYLRTGRVFPTHNSVAEVLLGRDGSQRRRLVMTLRSVVDEAMRETAFLSGLDVATLNYVEWQLARTICVSELGRDWHPHCDSAPRAELPEDIAKLVGKQCPYKDGCQARDDRSYEWFNEPQFEKAIY